MLSFIAWIAGCFLFFLWFRRHQFLGIRPWWFVGIHAVVDILAIVNPVSFYLEPWIGGFMALVGYVTTIIIYIVIRYVYFRRLLSLKITFIPVEIFIYFVGISLMDTVATVFH